MFSTRKYWLRLKDGGFFLLPSPGRVRSFTFRILRSALQLPANQPSHRGECPDDGWHRTKGNNHESDEDSRPGPHRVPGLPRMVTAEDRGRPRPKSVYDQERTARAPPRQRQGLRMLEQALRTLRRVPAKDILGTRGGPAEELARMLRVVPGLPARRPATALPGLRSSATDASTSGDVR